MHYSRGAGPAARHWDWLGGQGGRHRDVPMTNVPAFLRALSRLHAGSRGLGRRLGGERSLGTEIRSVIGVGVPAAYLPSSLPLSSLENPRFTPALRCSGDGGGGWNVRMEE